MDGEVSCVCHDKDMNYTNQEHMPMILNKNEENEFWKIVDFTKGEKVGDFTMYVWNAVCKKCDKVYAYSIGVDLDCDMERVIKLRETISPVACPLPRSKL